MPDEIMRELWRAKDEIAKQFNYDIEALARELRRRSEGVGSKARQPGKASR